MTSAGQVALVQPKLKIVFRILIVRMELVNDLLFV